MDASSSVKLTLMKDSDLELLLAWRSHPQIYLFFKQQNGPLTWNEHLSFWKNRRHREDFLIEFKEDGLWRKVGSVNLSKLNTQYPEIGILVGEITLQGRHIGTKAISLALEELKNRAHKSASVTIHSENEASKKLFTHFGFKMVTNSATDSWQDYRLESIS